MYKHFSFIDGCIGSLGIVKIVVLKLRPAIKNIILPQEKFLQFDWLRAVVFELTLKYLHVKITNLLRVAV